MSEIVKIKDKTFKLSITEKEISHAIDRIAGRMNEDLDGKDPLFIAVLNGAFMFASEIMKRVNIPSQITFVRVQSYYDEIQTTGKYKEVFGLTEDIENRTVVVLEDIIDSGFTIRNMLELLQAKKPEKIKIAVLLLKPDALQCEVKPDYVAFSIPNDFIVGYGLDYAGYGRNLKDIYSIVDE
ncbi:MAG: hypoxanthine phosphoribosyltransferase [Candidatus Azobacteroides sp.]|nr:hypoxanthine phosphoribosyltransferase [Candidatus Azobacteroides sp.]